MGLSSSLSFDAIPAAPCCDFGTLWQFLGAKALDSKRKAIESCLSANAIVWRPLARFMAHAAQPCYGRCSQQTRAVPHRTHTSTGILENSEKPTRGTVLGPSLPARLHTSLAKLEGPLRLCISQRCSIPCSSSVRVFLLPSRQALSTTMTGLTDQEYRGVWNSLQGQENHVCTRQVRASWGPGAGTGSTPAGVGARPRRDRRRRRLVATG